MQTKGTIPTDEVVNLDLFLLGLTKVNGKLPGEDKANFPVLSTLLHYLLLSQQRRIRKYCCTDLWIHCQRKRRHLRRTVSKSNWQDTCCYTQQKNQDFVTKTGNTHISANPVTTQLCLCTFTKQGKESIHICTPLEPYSACITNTSASHNSSRNQPQLPVERNVCVNKCHIISVKEHFHIGWIPS